MNPSRLSIELPLLKRELIELAQHKRTYVLRCLCLVVFALVFLTAYSAFKLHSYNITRMLGHGREMTYILFFTLMTTIYALAPAMACSAITSEKEKQTLGLLLTSKLSPFAIVIEKIFSRMVPLLSLVVVASPLFGLCYLFGGLSFNDTLLGIGFLLFVVFQVTAVAVFCSALVESSIAAFWLTYGVLLVMYFAWPVLAEMHLLPRMHAIGFPDAEFLLFPFYQVAMLSEANGVPGVASSGRTFWVTVPSLVITLCFPIAAWFAMVKFAYGSATSLGTILLRWKGRAARLFAHILPDGSWKRQVTQSSADADSPLAERISTDFPARSPIVWRERRSTAMLKIPIQLSFLGGLLIAELWCMAITRQSDRDEVAVFFNCAVLILSLLMILSLGSRLFTKERERQTFDSLLAAPLDNRQLLADKTSGINQLILFLLIPVFLAGIFNVINSRMEMSSLTFRPTPNGPYRSRHDVAGFSWLVSSGVYFAVALGNAFIYLHLVKWVALYFGLKMKTHMKAMISSLVSILVLCLVPLILLTLVMVATNSNPREFPLWFFSSPAIMVIVNQIHDLPETYERTFLPDSDLFVIQLNFILYGGLMLLARQYVLNKLPDLLNRRDPEIWLPLEDGDLEESLT